jgi:branched-chain amino acid transport system ATP-binding protein
MSLLECRDIHTYYGDSHILQGISLLVEEGRVISVIGRNGMGKSTLVHSIVAFNSPRRGKIIYRGQDITDWKTFEIAQIGIRLVPQGRRVFQSLTTKETLAIAYNRGSLWTLDRLFLVFPRLKERLHSRSRDLSGGEQQMLSISRALAGQPELLLMDEPSEGLAPLLVAEMRRIVLEIKAQGVSIVLVEQNLPFALKVADYVYVISKGTIAYESEPGKLVENTEVQSRYLGI